MISLSVSKRLANDCAICRNGTPDNRQFDRMVVGLSWLGGIAPAIGGSEAVVLQSRRHVENLWELSEEEAAELGTVARKLAAIINIQLDVERLYVASFGEKYRHLHFLLLPLRVGTHPGTRGAKFLDNYLEGIG
jgi:galactose-1-phosphate uridylyltransferase